MKVINRLDPQVFHLSKAILIRSGSRDGYGNSPAVASIHDVVPNKQGVPEIGSGRLMTRKALSELVRSITPEQSMRLLPDRILASGVEGVMWWKKPSTENVWFNTNKDRDQIGMRCGRVPLPGLVFVTSRGTLKVFAVKGDSKPTATTPLYQAPFYNVDKAGNVCRGNAAMPTESSTIDIDGYEKGFFQSRFTHPNVHIQSELSRYRGGAAALWRSLLSGKRSLFPEKSLVPMGVTLEAWLDGFTAANQARRGVAA